MKCILSFLFFGFAVSVSPSWGQEPSAEIVGKIKVFSGSVSLVDETGRRRVVKTEEIVREKDRVEAAEDGAAILSFEGGNKLHVLPGTWVAVQEFKAPRQEDSRRVLLHLIKGKIRNQVVQKYNGEMSSYRVTTKAAVASVRGTDFVVSHQEESGGRHQTRVETIKGLVQFSGIDTPELSDRGRVELNRGHGAVFSGGAMGAAFKISDADMRVVDQSSRADLVRSQKNSRPEAPICDQPKGLFNQCAWKCKGNPKGQERCRTDLQGVSCVRLRCDAQGRWADETKLSGPAGLTQCLGKADQVKDCDY